MAHSPAAQRFTELAQTGDRLALIVDDAAWIWVGEEGLWLQYEGAMEGYLLDADEMAAHIQEQEEAGAPCLQTTASQGRVDHQRSAAVSRVVKLTASQLKDQAQHTA
jgi:hypothetical protein